MDIFCGCDVGSMTAKAVLMKDGKILSSAIILAELDAAQSAYDVVDKALERAALVWDDITITVSTGYGRERASFAHKSESEIICHGRGAWWSRPETRTVIDIGGQDSKLLKLDGNGKVRDFSMNDRCAGGTGRFLEVVADRLEVSLDDLGSKASKSKEPAVISSMCVVFAETEIIGLLATGIAREDIIAGVQKAIAERVVAMAGRTFDLPIAFTGGVAMISGMDSALKSALGCDITISPNPQITGALGAAILASA